MDKYHENIRSIRKRLRLTQEAISDMMGIQRSTYGRFERGETHLFTANTRRFLRATGKTVEDIVDLNGEERGGFLREASVEDRVLELSEEIRSLRSITEMLAARIEKLSKK